MDGNPAAFHAAEVGHLTFGKLVYGNLQLAYHFVVCEFTDDMHGEVFIFQSVINQILGCNARCEYATHFVDHALLLALVQAAGDALAAQFA